MAEHSDFRVDPWRRLSSTLRSYLRIVYGTSAQAAAEIDRLRRLHLPVRGALPGGSRYSARDPELALWVHATLVDSTLATAAAWLTQLDRSDRARAYEESRRLGSAFGIPDALLPRDIDGFDAYMTAMTGPAGPVHPTPVARELARAVLAPPPGPALRTLASAATRVVPASLAAPIGALADRVPAGSVAWLLWPSIGLLPGRVREEYGLPWRLPHRVVAGWLVRSWRAWNGALPASIRHMPQARAADGRLVRAALSTGRGIAT